MTRRRKHEELTDKQKARIVDLHRKHNLPYSTLATRFDVSAEHVSRLVQEANNAQGKPTSAE